MTKRENKNIDKKKLKYYGHDFVKNHLISKEC